MPIGQQVQEGSVLGAIANLPPLTIEVVDDVVEYGRESGASVRA